MRIFSRLVSVVFILGAFVVSCGSSSDDEDDTPPYTVPEAVSGFCQFDDSESVCVNYNGAENDSPNLALDCEAENSGALALGEWNTGGACSSFDLFAYCIFNMDSGTEYFKYYYLTDGGLQWDEKGARDDCSSLESPYSARAESGTLVLL